MYDQNNVFAKILRGEIPSFKVYEDAQVLSFMDAMPQSEGHTLVIPKVEARNFFDIAPAALADLIKATQYVAKGVQQALKPDGMRIIQFNESAAGQTVFHIHFHILPCYEGVELRGHTRDWGDKGVLAAQAEKIRAALATLPPR
ncbi:HIT family protein [Steroidobacter sp.]|uniref:HIT family protein n=1 Tax=Steroidobacter sp. TaxID=1978227 RepID=UPI001A446F51|nr:HIT family protein [Steroidobacter sp.]MBL8268263.1 HIT family protein [Steroidobacter sp.]